jgi:7-cyano-7-deazaguanine synthase
VPDSASSGSGARARAQAQAQAQKSVVLLSGGLDSAANLALCKATDRPVLALTVDYGQRAARREIEAARALCEHYGVAHQLVELKWLGALGGSALTESTRILPDLATALLDDRQAAEETAAAVWVPNRNGVLINVASAFAERAGAEQVVVGFNAEEAVTFPDNSTEFLERSTHALALSTRNQVRVHCYTDRMNKTEIVARLKQLGGFPFELLWSCYQGGEKPCGKCESCRRSARAFAAGD